MTRATQRWPKSECQLKKPTKCLKICNANNSNRQKQQKEMQKKNIYEKKGSSAKLNDKHCEKLPLGVHLLLINGSSVSGRCQVAGQLKMWKQHPSGGATSCSTTSTSNGSSGSGSSPERTILMESLSRAHDTFYNFFSIFFSTFSLFPSFIFYFCP